MALTMRNKWKLQRVQNTRLFSEGSNYGEYYISSVRSKLVPAHLEAQLFKQLVLTFKALNNLSLKNCFIPEESTHLPGEALFWITITEAWLGVGTRLSQWPCQTVELPPSDPCKCQVFKHFVNITWFYQVYILNVLL